MNHAVLAAALTAGLVACRPDLGERASLVTRTQVLAVRGEPPEVKPGEVARFDVLVATPDGPIATPLASWALCSTPKLLTENGAASAACLRSGAVPIADGAPSVEVAIPPDACALFGPEVTSADLRPRDPDLTGGYFQPVRVTVFGQGESPSIAFGLERLRCNLANAAADVAADFGERYATNENPQLLPLVATHEGAPVALDAIPRGARVTLHASWTEASPERYVAYDPATRALAERRESMRVSWFATAGAFESDRTGRSDDELETFTSNDWTAPPSARTTHVFVVLRDARGGVSFATHVLVTR